MEPLTASSVVETGMVDNSYTQVCMKGSKNSLIAKKGNRAETTICTQENIKPSFEKYYGSSICKISLIGKRKKSDLEITFEDGTTSRLQNKDGSGGGRGYSVDRRKVDAYNNETLTKLLTSQCLKQGIEKPSVLSDVSKKVITMCICGDNAEFVPEYFTHTKSDKMTGQILSLSICHTETLIAFLHSEVYHEMNIMPPKRTCVHLSPHIYLQRKGGGKKDPNPDDIQMKFIFTEAVEKLFTTIFMQTNPQ